jgi:hypothetical protein
VQVGGVVPPELDSEHGAIHNSFIPQTAKPPIPLPVAPVEDAAEALFEEARQRARRRRRRRVALALGALLAAGAALLIASGGIEPVHRRATPAPPVVAARSVLTARPSMGVSCSVPNSIACDRVAILLATRRPARAVSVTIGGRSTVLDDLMWSEPWRHGVKREFSGYLRPAGMRDRGPLRVRTEHGDDYFSGVHPVTPVMRVVITYADGSRRATSVRTYLSPGWG